MPFETRPVGQQLSCLRSAQQFFRRCYDSLDTSIETLLVAHLDSARRCFHLSRHEGEEASVSFPLKAIVREVIQRESAGLLLAHNHPSGDPSPSESDLAATRRLCIVSEALDCAVLDHLVLAGDDCASFRSLGLL